ncbi:3-oxoacid CoA-transferase subunit B [Paracoccus onubensis]|uniref:3-oxoacid CoA-transferase subunit B n=1 Tax=Paracoccus onubensis TaxID=1675788 RepID=UPI00272FCD18|nr:3-oxoacid CoA-transferase subunit B [Paracoccus onubensis]MDP0927346.1 3-oxoacid CoA-transferase subunit B [Paracoccus onubensis]
MKPLDENGMAARLAQDIPDGAYVNLGIGLPNRVAHFVPAGREVMYHTENGLLGVGPVPRTEQEDPELINASKKLVTMVPGASLFDHTLSFAMMRGNHLSIAVLGAYQVAENGDLANWATLEQNFPPAVGGAMDLVAGVPQIYALMRHNSRDGAPKVLKRCTYPLTGAGVLTRVYTDLCVLEVTPEGFKLIDLAEGNSLEEVQAVTEARILT